MTEKSRYLLFFIILTASAIFVEYLSPKKINWKYSYSKEDKIPFGCYVLFDLLPDIFPGKKITAVNLNFYEYELDSGNTAMNYIVINDQYNPGKEEIKSLIYFAENGGIAFLSAEKFGNELADSLGISTGIELLLMDSLKIRFKTSAFRETYCFPSMKQSSVITGFDSSKTQVLAYAGNNKPILIKIKLGDGFVLINTTPFAFTNYHILESENTSFISAVFGFLPAQNVLWDEYHKIGGPQSATVIRYILYSDPLRWAYFLSLLSVLLFFVFESKRRQRIIPVIKKVTNSTLDFVETVSLLYLSYENHKVIADKRIAYFHEYLRTKWFIRQDQILQIEYVAMKTGCSAADLKLLFDQIHTLEKKDLISDTDLLLLNGHLEQFYKKVK